MAQIEYTQGIECKRCGNIIYRLHDMHPLCQECGARIISGYSKEDGITLTSEAKGVVVKVTHKFFFEKCEKVRDL